MRRFLLSPALIVLLVANCTMQPVAFTSTPGAPEPTSLPSTAQEAQDVLVDFFTLLNVGNYAEAVPLYGGGYEIFQGWNPAVDPDDHVLLWTRACQQNGLQCLLARTITLQQLQGDTYIFQVEFSNPDGSLFVLGPCCGANETEMPPVSEFEFTVRRNADRRFVVMNTPPYVP